MEEEGWEEGIVIEEEGMEGGEARRLIVRVGRVGGKGKKKLGNEK
jgi:hypothetical protein